MNIMRAVILAAIAILGLAGFLFMRGTEEPPVIAQQADTSGMSGMAETTEPVCLRYDLINRVWVCTAKGAGTGATAGTDASARNGNPPPAGSTR